MNRASKVQKPEQPARRASRRLLEKTENAAISKTKASNVCKPEEECLETETKEKSRKFEPKGVEDNILELKMKGTKLLTSSCKLVGAHVSAAGGLENAPLNAAEIGAKAFALFLTSGRTWKRAALAESTAEKFKDACKTSGFSPHAILPHGSYLLNCGSPNPETLKKSRETLTDELQRCEKLGLAMYNFHPGSTCGSITVDECLDLIAESIDLAHAKTKYVVTVVENMSRQGHTIGGDFAELRGIIDRVKDQSRMGVCIDTCHAFAAGYDVSTKEGFEAMLREFDSVIGMKYLRALHLNDSKGKLGCRKDRHESIGKGFIGADCFRRIMRDPRFDSLPLILETPYSDDIYEREIKLLKSFEVV